MFVDVAAVSIRSVTGFEDLMTAFILVSRGLESEVPRLQCFVARVWRERQWL